MNTDKPIEEKIYQLIKDAANDYSAVDNWTNKDNILRHYTNEVLKLQSPSLPVEQVNYVPYQTCPKCNGQGILAKPPYVPGDVYEWSATTLTSHQCNLCNGAKIIPMYAIPVEQGEVYTMEEVINFYEDYKAYVAACVVSPPVSFRSYMSIPLVKLSPPDNSNTRVIEYLENKLTELSKRPQGYNAYAVTEIAAWIKELESKEVKREEIG